MCAALESIRSTLKKYSMRKPGSAPSIEVEVEAGEQADGADLPVNDIESRSRFLELDPVSGEPDAPETEGSDDSPAAPEPKEPAPLRLVSYGAERAKPKGGPSLSFGRPLDGMPSGADTPPKRGRGRPRKTY